MEKGYTEGLKLMSADGHVLTRDEIHKILNNDEKKEHREIKMNYYYKDNNGIMYKYDEILDKGFYLVDNKWIYSREITDLFRVNRVEGLGRYKRIYYYQDLYENGNQEKEDIMKSGLMGFVVGDALGVPFEFKSRRYMDQNPFIDMVENGSHHQPLGTWSDDTSMTIATMDSIAQTGEISVTDIMNRFLSWYRNADYTAGNLVFDMGITTQISLDNYSRGKNPLECGQKREYSNGNGSLMRMLPIAYYIWSNAIEEEEATKLINELSSITHAHPISQLGCKIYCDYLSYLMDGADKYYAYFMLQQNDYEKYYPKEVVEKYQRILDGSIIVQSASRISGSGYIVDTLEASIWASFNSENYEEALKNAINLGDDTDTVGAITGSMAGIMYGYKSIPEKWVSAIKRLDYIMNLCQNFTQKIITVPEKEAINPVEVKKRFLEELGKAIQEQKNNTSQGKKL